MKKINVYNVKYTKISLSGNDRAYETGYKTLEELKDYFSYTLECGRSYQYRKGSKKIKSNDEIKTIKSLISNLNNACANSCSHYQSTYYDLKDSKKIPEEEIRN